MAGPSYVFVGDDFTGACDTLATLARGGLRARLYTRFPDRMPDDLDAVGIATELRAMTPAEGRAVMQELAPKVAGLGARITHFKICSTFDSSPKTGNIPAVAEVFEAALGAEFTAIVGGQPSLHRYSLFGVLFAATADGDIYRIDRHPVMRNHPITPMGEADLRRHLEMQGWSGIGLVDYRSYDAGIASLEAAVEWRIADSENRVLFDVSRESDLETIGRALWNIAGKMRVLCIGASSVAEAVLPFAQKNATPSPAPIFPHREGPLLILSGSRSPTTAAQIAAAKTYEKIEVAASDLVEGTANARQAGLCALALLEAGRNALVQVAEGLDGTIAGRDISRGFARFASGILACSRPACLVVAGGDTSSAIISGLDVESLEFIHDIDPGVSLVQASGSTAVQGLPMVLKGGQMGAVDLFDRLGQSYSGLDHQ